MNPRPLPGRRLHPQRPPHRPHTVAHVRQSRAALSEGVEPTAIVGDLEQNAPASSQRWTRTVAPSPAYFAAF